ncbi:NADH-quinone oxidoreductase subunit A [Sphingobacteriaceae bacterium WQ 2009]|uniref:NADH-quinone oxidoreductase subunit A n=1 Tax=Rhinopithecimicrobium faecis TaxID=2820698 RepID=A0A8T4HA91_9SPHI|nr:NADH-quinone oxidoreductase subunit A [Sphingobacteriaceae bacterium WQ 2009]
MDDPAQLSEYGKILIIVLVGIILVSITIFMGKLIAPNKPNPIKNSTYECGEIPVGSSWVQFNPRFYVIALVFLLFDVELIFIFPWATVFGQADLIAADPRWGIFTLVEMGLFLAVLILGLVFVWKKGDLEWVKPTHRIPSLTRSIPTTAYAAINEASYKVRDFQEPAPTVTDAPEQEGAAGVLAEKKVATGYKPRFNKSIK